MLQYRIPNSIVLQFTLAAILIASCGSPSVKDNATLYNTHCGSCHKAPDINSLPSDIWENQILPDMASRMGIKEGNFNPYLGMSYDEMEAAMKTRIYNPKPAISVDEWTKLRDYIVGMAPDSLPSIPEIAFEQLSEFDEEPLVLDEISGSKNITYLEYLESENEMIYADLRGEVHRFDWDTKVDKIIAQFATPVIGYAETPSTTYTTTIGQLSPTQIPTGQFYVKNDQGIQRPVAGFLHRPVHMLVEDLNMNGEEDIVISEFGDLVGKLSVFVNVGEKGYEKRILLNQPGTIRVIAKDMNADGLKDLIALTAQGDEGIWVFYQEENMRFRAERVLRFSPVYGSSWFELFDYDNDGDDDLFTVHGDNADKSYVHKPYHGLRIHLNDGNNNFEEAYFYPLYGATRVLARDFDQDGDMDFCLLATFPDYHKEPLLPFVYLQNENSTSFEFSSKVLKSPSMGRWLLADVGDIDQDGDEDIILSSFTYVFTPVPDELNKGWNSNNIDMLVLKNKLFQNE